MDLIVNLENMLAAGQDSPALRYGLGNAYLGQGQADKAVEHLAQAVNQNPSYSAAWKLLGKALAETGRVAEAATAYESGIRVAEVAGDVQAAKEMHVFLRRLKRANNP